MRAVDNQGKQQAHAVDNKLICAIFVAPVLYRTPQALNLQGAGEGVGGPLEGPPGDIPGDLQAFGDSGPWGIPGGYRGDPVWYTSEGIPCGVSWGIPCESHTQC